MSLARSRGIVLAGGTAVLMHLLLFAVVLPSGGQRREQAPVPPHTRYMPGSVDDTIDGSMVRTIKSPVVFSLPSAMGFSRELQAHDVRTRLSFQQQVQAEHYLVIAPSGKAAEERLDPRSLMVSTRVAGPSLPSRTLTSGKVRPPARRVTMAPELLPRLMGGIVLPAELNKVAAKPWEVHASVSISEQGGVNHVFLEQPLESELLNQQVLQLLYSLRFKPGIAVESSIDIYSPEPDPGVGVPQ